MPASVVTTKLYIPPIRPQWVSRPRLVAQLNGVFDRKLALVSAPAGFGKTTLLSEWSAQCEHAVAWLSLDAADNDPVRFWAHLIAALQKVVPDLGAAAQTVLRESPAPAMDSVVTGLVNEIAEIHSPMVIVLDDLHVIVERPVHDGLTFLLDNLPSSLRICLAGRADPPWGLARMRVRGEVVEIRARDLRFTPDEVTAFLNDSMKLALAPEQVTALDVQTEGWIAGLQLAVLSLQGRDDAAAFISAFSGSNRFILDYLVEEVLERQPEDVRAFLLKTSLLQQMTAPLCNAVTGRDDGQESLAWLDQANLFLVPLDDERRWYRYHHLFADLLNSYLQTTYPGQIQALHQRASDWYAQNGMVADAIGHALAAGDVERATRLVEGNAHAAIFHGELASLLRWLQALPEEVVRARPWLSIAYAWVLAFSGQVDAVEGRLQDAERGLRQREDLDGRHVRGHMRAMRAYTAALQADIATATELAQAALADLPESDVMARSFVTTLLGAFLRWSGDYGAAVDLWAEVMATARAANHSRNVFLALNALVAVRIEQGQLNRAHAVCREACELAEDHRRRTGRPIPSVGPVYARLSFLLRERNELEKALHYARTALEHSQRWGQAEGMTTCYAALGDVLFAMGRMDEAEAAMRDAHRVATSLSPWYGELVAAEQVQYWLADGDLASALDWMQHSGMSVGDDFPFVDHFKYLALARVLVAQGSSGAAHETHTILAQALDLLERILSMVERAGAVDAAIRTLLLQALALQARAGDDQALAVLGRALTLAEPEGYLRIFVDEGAPMARLLRLASARGMAVPYVGKLLSAFDGEDAAADVAAEAPVLPTSLQTGQIDSPVEPLSERELDVLRLLNTSLTSTEIAAQLVVAPSTVRSHIKSIYAKLDVHRRGDAVARAKELHLL